MLIEFFLLSSLLFDLCQSINTPPVIVEQPQDLIAELDKPMAIHCRAESSSLDDLHIDWYKDGRLVTTDPNARIITEFMALHVINTMPQDAGVYHCIARNSHGQTPSRKARVQFLRLDKEFLISPVSTSASIGEHIRFRCQPPHGSPSPTVYWTKDGKNLSIPLDHHDLVLSSIQKFDFGIYRCIASNGLLRQSSPAYLTEFHRPKISLQPSTSRIDLRRGQLLHLECHIDNDQYTLEWHFQEQSFPNQTVDISAIEFHQSGVYTCIGRLDKYAFSEQILVAVHDRESAKIFSRSNRTVFLGQSASLDCQLPLHPEKKISWTILNQSAIDQIKFDANGYHLKIPRIKEIHQNIFFQCSYEHQPSDGLIQLNLQRVQPPPMISYVPNNQTVPIGVEVEFPCQSNDQSKIQWWFTPSNRPYKTIKIDNNRKYRMDTNHGLIIRHVDKTDAGVYQCVSTNRKYNQATWSAHLSVEDARSNAIFHRVERKDLPTAPSQPIAASINSHSIELTWEMQSNDIRDYLIEYYRIPSEEEQLQWEYFVTKHETSRQIIPNLQGDSIYQFIIRARNSFGYGLPSVLSDLIETKNNSQSNEFIHLYDPIHIQETSITIKWNLLQNQDSIKQFSVYITNEKDANERIETITSPLLTYTINNLRSNTDYSIRLVPLLNVISRASNKIFVRTLESIPSSSPTHIVVQLTSTTSLSVQWNSPLSNETNGEILAYKVNCLSANESNSIRLTNISSDAKGLVIKNLIEHTEYCISIAARTRIGYGPYSPPICVTMNETFLRINRNGFRYYLREVISQAWFLPVIIISSIVFTCAFSYVLWLCFHYLTEQHRHRIKFNSSSSSSNQSVELPIQKTLSNGKRYDLIKDTPPPPPIPSSTALWMNSIPNSIRLQCCTTTTLGSAGSHSEHNSMNIHKNPINALLHESRQGQQLNPYATTGLFQQSTTPSLPTYSETVHSLHRQAQITSPSSPSAQYQPPWLDHYSSSTMQYRSQSMTPHHCVHCPSQSHTHTPTSIRTTLRSPSAAPHQSTNSNIQTSTNERKKMTTMENIPIKMNSLPLEKHQVQSSNPIMINSLGGETMTTSWASSNDDHKSESTSSSIDRNESGNKPDQPSSEGSLFSDSDPQPQDESNPTPIVPFERGPSFLIPNV